MNGGLPVASSYRTMPRDHQSELTSWPASFKISGDIYSGVPQIEKVYYLLLSKEFVGFYLLDFFDENSSCFANPKSLNFM
jgi:hypothetical protein